MKIAEKWHNHLTLHVYNAVHIQTHGINFVMDIGLLHGLVFLHCMHAILLSNVTIMIVIIIMTLGSRIVI